MARGTEPENCNIDNIDEYHAMRDEALTNVRAPPPSEYDITQLKEAFADIAGENDYDGPELIPKTWQPELRMFTEDEFVSKVTIDGQVRHTTSDAISASYNYDRYNPVEGELVKAADDLAAFMEAYLALQNGISNAQLQTAVQEKKLFYHEKTIAGINLDEVYRGFY